MVGFFDVAGGEIVRFRWLSCEQQTLGDLRALSRWPRTTAQPVTLSAHLLPPREIAAVVFEARRGCGLRLFDHGRLQHFGLRRDWFRLRLDF